MSSTIGSQFTIYVGSVLFSLGFSGNLVSIYLLYPTRRTAITFILIVLSFANCISLIVGLLNRVLVTIVGVDPTLISPVWCRLRVYVGQTAVLFCQSCACLASINCFLLTCRQQRWRRYVSLSRAGYYLIIAAIFWLTHGLFNPILTELNVVIGKTSTCSLSSLIASNYSGFFLRPVLIGVFPITTLSIFGFLTFRNLSQLHHKRRFDQLRVCRMLLFQMIAYIFGTVPYASFYAYQSVTAVLYVKSSFVRAQESLTLDFINIIFYMPQASPFYVYYLSSGTFRKQVQELFLPHRRNNRVQPVVRLINPK